MSALIMRSGDIRAAADIAFDAMIPALNRDWSVRAGDLDWSCRRTLDHIIDTLVLYAFAVALPVMSREEWIPPRNGDPDATVSDLLEVLRRQAGVLEAACDASLPPARAFHPSGLSDADGFRAMACSEVLTHADDILMGFGLSRAFEPPAYLCDRIVRRVFPWAPEADACPNRLHAVKWACGRMALPDHPRLDDRWWWHSAPIEEWDGSRNERNAPPAWS
ncbi:MAG TPA: hypothetical protein VGR08_10870 [Thermomicrobiales bacterium]|nr:hypothetical protein [Thermomicrobiales bacterium]